MGALTSKPFTFTARSWELSDRLTYDFTDTFFSAIKVSFRGSSVMRILPEFSQTMLSEWISDRARFSYDSIALSDQSRDTLAGLDVPLTSVFWLNYFSKRFSTYFSNFFRSPYVDLSAAKRIGSFFQMSGLGLYVARTYDFRSYCVDYFKFCSVVPSFKYVFLVGINLRYQLPVLAASFRKVSAQPDYSFFSFGFFSNNLLNEINLGFRNRDLVDFSRAKSRVSRFFLKNLSSSALITSPQLADLFKNPLFATKVFTFFDLPNSLSFAEINGFSTKLNFCTSASGSFSNPHPFSYSAYNIRAGKYQKFESFYSSMFYGNSTFFFKANARVADFFGDFSTFAHKSQLLYFYANFYSHYTDFAFSGNSLNILVSLRRQIDSRSSFSYYT